MAIFLCQQISFAQNETINWWDPAENTFHVIEGQAWPDNVQSSYDRLPAKAEKNVRQPVWNLSKHSAGLLVRFWTNAPNIHVRYQVGGNHAMPHMPATGVSGMDLYAKNSDGGWLWCRGRYSFGDTIKYNFTGINPEEQYHKMGREYRLYLPLYNSVQWLEIGVPDGTRFDPLPVRLEKPIVIYGTSIAQGACASRPGMAWTSILERKMDRPVINLAFSGNGRLEPELIDLLTEIDAKVYVLDCLPNLVQTKDRPLEEVHRRIKASVNGLRQKRKNTPILLVEHDGYSDGATNPQRYKAYSELNEVMREAFAELQAGGIKGIYLLTKKQINMGMDDFVDGTHPTDLGMVHYADAYEKTLREILNEPVGNISTTMPVTQAREPGNYNWERRHRELLQLNATDPPKICFFGNSITHFWGGEPKGPKNNGGKTWNKTFEGLDVRNFGYGWDRVENALWRVYHGELDGFQAEKILLMLGTNNLHLNTDKEIINGLELLVDAIKSRQPNAKILMIGILPRRDNESRVHGLNLKMAQMASTLHVDYSDPGKVLLNHENKIDESYFSDGLHPNEKGYGLLSPLIRKLLVE